MCIRDRHMGCGYIDLNRFLWRCAWLHVFINSEDRDELEELFQYYGDGGRLPSSRSLVSCVPGETNGKAFFYEDV